MIAGKFDWTYKKTRSEVDKFLNDNQPFTFLQIIHDKEASSPFTIFYAKSKLVDKDETL